jgi:Xaa-Pro aminopeptidase
VQKAIAGEQVFDSGRMRESTLSHITSTPERQRRHEALRGVMAAGGLDALVICGRGDEFVRGRLQYVSDIFQWAGWGFVVLPARGEAVYVGDPLWGTARAEAAGWLSEFRLTATPGEEIAGILADLGLARGRVGLVGIADAASFAHVNALQAAAKDAEFDDATARFDDVKIVKSAEEIAHLRQTSDILRRVFGALAAELRPGVPESDVLAEAHRLARQYGCVDGIAIMGRPPFRFFGAGSPIAIQRSDIVVIDLEWGGPGGYWLELRRCFSFGAPSDEARRFWEVRRESFAACVDAIRPGASSDDIIRARDAAYAAAGLPPVGGIRYSAHGIGLDSLEPPWAPGNERVLREGMVLSLHPDIEFADAATRARLGGISIADNVLVTATGAERLTDPEIEWVTL